MSNEKNSQIEIEIAEILGLLPTEQTIIITLRYEGGINSLKKPIADARQRLEELLARLKGKFSEKKGDET